MATRRFFSRELSAMVADERCHPQQSSGQFLTRWSVRAEDPLRDSRELVWNVLAGMERSLGGVSVSTASGGNAEP